MSNTGNLTPTRQLRGVRARKAKKAYLKALVESETAQQSDALDLTGITISQLRRWRDSDPEFRDLETQARLKRDDVLRRKIDEYVAGGDRDMIKFAAKRLEEYNPAKRTELEVTGTVRHAHLLSKSQEELDRIILAAAESLEVPFEVVKKDGEVHSEVPPMLPPSGDDISGE